jgi:hypothetical protein
MDLLVELLEEAPALESLTIRCPPRRMLEDLDIHDILVGPKVPPLHFEGVLPSTVHQFILECRPKQPLSCTPSLHGSGRVHTTNERFLRDSRGYRVCMEST